MKSLQDDLDTGFRLVKNTLQIFKAFHGTTALYLLFLKQTTLFPSIFLNMLHTFELLH